MSEDDDDEIERDENRPASVFPGEERGSHERTNDGTNERCDVIDFLCGGMTAVSLVARTAAAIYRVCQSLLSQPLPT